MPSIMVLKMCQTPQPNTCLALPGVDNTMFLPAAGTRRGVVTTIHHWAPLDFMQQANHIPATNLIRSQTAWYKDSRVSLCLGTETSSGCPYSSAPEEVLDGLDFFSLK